MTTTMTTPKRKAAWCANTQTAIQTSNSNSNMNAIEKIATSACNQCARAAFSVINYRGDGKLKKQSRTLHKPGRDTISFGAIHTTKQAGNLPDSEVFSRSEFDAGLHFQGSDGYGAGSAYPQGRQHNLFCVDIPSSTLWPIQPDGGFSVQQGTEPMTNVIPMACARAAKSTQSHTSSLDIPQQQAAIENALAMAAYYMRQPRTPETLHAAIGKTSRAMTLLKNACADSLAQNGGAA